MSTTVQIGIALALVAFLYYKFTRVGVTEQELSDAKEQDKQDKSDLEAASSTIVTQEMAARTKEDEETAASPDDLARRMRDRFTRPAKPPTK